jgi:hypothetical protein
MLLRNRRGLLLVLTLSAALCACNAVPSMDNPQTEPVPGYVTDTQAFERFIATRPTPEQFRQRYPDVQLVLPGQLATKELRMNNSRYFAELDDEGRITGGKFK